MILSDTVKMKEYLDDPEMHMDLMYRIAKGTRNCVLYPDPFRSALANLSDLEQNHVPTKK